MVFEQDNSNYAILGATHIRPKNYQEVYHPVQQNLKNYKEKENRTLLMGLMRTQGMHMPLRLAMEKKVFESVGRLPILKSSHLHKEVLNDTLDTITELDYLNPSEFNETLVPSFVVMDKDLKF
ncbi:uncharacterized protein LOC126900447 [Daktulosphaira vitifoliae]|uniref:uncharacterized protein LOC126900447 n=1 Tax=Daktulosphaira vitifoliae TaxID=58002 RepID=UPI0021AAEC57|nr:uncharacterized protein LOC126900447 [Daktulosphaira vitifoliae]